LLLVDISALDVQGTVMSWFTIFNLLYGEPWRDGTSVYAITCVGCSLALGRLVGVALQRRETTSLTTLMYLSTVCAALIYIPNYFVRSDNKAVINTAAGTMVISGFFTGGLAGK